MQFLKVYCPYFTEKKAYVPDTAALKKATEFDNKLIRHTPPWHRYLSIFGKYGCYTQHNCSATRAKQRAVCENVPVVYNIWNRKEINYHFDGTSSI